MLNIILGSGKGSRFLKYGYKTPKPFLPFKKSLFIITSAKFFYSFGSNIFVILNKHKKFKDAINILKRVKNSKIFYIKKILNGQAKTAYQVISNIKQNNIINICPSDCYISFDKKNYFKLIRNSDVIIFTHKANKSSLNISNYGWLIHKNLNIQQIKCKKKINSISNVEIITGFFSFNLGKNLKIEMKNFLKKEKYKINNEYYLDMFCKYLFERHYKVKFIRVKNIYKYGTPAEYREAINLTRN
jgi:NDP-sugar pyrophosphorylase family protein